MNSKAVSFIAMMGALGNVLFLLSYYLGALAPGVSFDFSLVGVLIAGMYGGPIVGLVTGLIAGVLPGVYFGPLQNNLIGLIGLPVGKALTGLTAGLLYRASKIDQKKRRSILTVPVTLVSYVPEFLFTIFYFLVLFSYFVGPFGAGLLMAVAPKAWIEVVVISFLMAALVGNQGFSNFANNFFAYRKQQASNKTN
jgi:riboflavin transporter FmnP